MTNVRLYSNAGALEEAKRRGLSCGVASVATTQTASGNNFDVRMKSWSDNYSLPKQYNKFSKFAFSFVSEGQIKSGSTTIALWRQGQRPTKWEGIIFLDGNKCQMSLKWDLRIRCQNGMDFFDDTNVEYAAYGKGNRDLRAKFYGRDYKNHRFDFKLAGIGTASKHDFIKSLPTTLPIESNLRTKCYAH